ncbi:MAG: hypothetical protein JWP75_509 [Frondihabitans sp.]|nr:hypothetical protein [Frondihabitans sp.]
MLLAWLSPQLEDCCVSGVRLRQATGTQIEAAEDLLHVITKSPRLESVGNFQSVLIGVESGNLTLSIDEVAVHAQPLTPEGRPRALVNRASLPAHASAEALLVQDIHVRGRSILRLVS